jgi:hypothetical protein
MLRRDKVAAVVYVLGNVSISLSALSLEFNSVVGIYV